MAKETQIPVRNDGELHRECLYLAIAMEGHPGSRKDFVPEGGDVIDGLTTHQVRGAFDLNDGCVGLDGVVAVQDVEAEGVMGVVLKEDITDWAVDDAVRYRGLYEPSGRSVSETV